MLVRGFRHKLNGDHAAADAVWQNVEDHAGFYAAVCHILRIVSWASARNNAGLVRALHEVVKELVASEWHPLHQEENGEGGSRASS